MENKLRGRPPKPYKIIRTHISLAESADTMAREKARRRGELFSEYVQGAIERDCESEDRHG